METMDLFLVNESRYNFQETCSKLQEIVTSAGWRVITAHNLQETMRKNEYDVLPVIVFEVCRPNLAVQILGNNEIREVSVMMPCRLSVFEKENGNVYISRMSLNPMLSMFPQEASVVMREANQEMETILQPIFE